MKVICIDASGGPLLPRGVLRVGESYTVIDEVRSSNGLWYQLAECPKWTSCSRSDSNLYISASKFILLSGTDEAEYANSISHETV